MIVDLKFLPVYKTEAQRQVGHFKIKQPIKLFVRFKRFFKSLNPTSWFSTFSDIDVDLNEFDYKKI